MRPKVSDLAALSPPAAIEDAVNVWAMGGRLPATKCMGYKESLCNAALRNALERFKQPPAVVSRTRLYVTA
jgi:hypothetical protein